MNVHENKAVSCLLDKARLDPIRSCMTNFLDPDPTGSEWANASISASAVAYSCGAIGRLGDTVEHEHDPGEWKVCRQLSAAAARKMDGIAIGMGSSLESYFSPFFVVADRGDKIPAVLDEATLRNAFGRTIYPGVQIDIEPLEERGEWWSLVRETLVDNDDALEDDELMAEGRADLARWSSLIRWYRSRNELHSASVIRMSAARKSKQTWTCCNFPCLVIGLTKAGSLVGIWGSIVDR